MFARLKILVWSTAIALAVGLGFLLLPGLGEGGWLPCFLVGAMTGTAMFLGACDVLNKLLAHRVEVQESYGNISVLTDPRNRRSEDEITKERLELNRRIRKHNEFIQMFPNDLVAWAVGFHTIEQQTSSSQR
jgi:hypothetical protein